MKHKENKEWNRKPQDLLKKDPAPINMSVYKLVSEAKKYTGKYALAKIEITYYRKFTNLETIESIINIGLLKYPTIISGRPYIVAFKNGERKTYELSEFTTVSTGAFIWSTLREGSKTQDILDNTNISTISVDNLILFDTEEEANLYYELEKEY